MKIFDAHFHIIDFQYPVIANNGYIPPEFTVKDYLAAKSKYHLSGGAVVSGSFQSFDHEFLKNTLKELGKNYFGVANIPKDITDQELEDLNNHQVVAVRFNLKRGGSETIEHLVYLSDKLYERFGWHTELYLDGKDLVELKPILSQIKKFSIDHLGLSKEGLTELFFWAEKGVKVKATGFGRVDFDPIGVLQQINTINPTSLMFGTDLPSTRAKTPFSEKDILKIRNHFDKQTLERIFYTNALAWYKRV